MISKKIHCTIESQRNYTKFIKKNSKCKKTPLENITCSVVFNIVHKKKIEIIPNRHKIRQTVEIQSIESFLVYHLLSSSNTNQT